MFVRACLNTLHRRLLLLAAACVPAATADAAQPPITALAFSPEGDLLVACSQAGVEVFSWPSLEPLRAIKTDAGALHDVAFSPDGRMLAVAGGFPSDSGMVELFAWPDGERLQTLSGPFDLVMEVAWRDDASLAAASLDHDAMLWHAASGETLRTLAGHSRGVTAAAFLPRGDVLVTAGVDQSVRVWNVDDGELIRSLSIHTQPIRDLAVRPGERRLPMVATASVDRTVRLWQPTIGRMVRFAKLRSAPLAVAWTPDGEQIVASCEDGGVRFIDPLAVQVVREEAALDGWAYALAVHPAGDGIAVGGAAGSLQRLPPADRSPSPR